MLRRLEIQNYAIIDQLDIEFPAGLTIITGETGAGKSILLGALGLIMGKRADSKVLYDQEKKCFVEATFDIECYNLMSFFEEESLDFHNELLIRREISTAGKSRAFINDTPVTLDVLQNLTDNLVDLHQQFDTLDIQKPSFQLQMIDALAGNKVTLENYITLYKSYKSTTRKLGDLKEKNRNANQEIEFLSFQLAEFSQAELKPGEKDDLETLLQRLSSAEEIKVNTTAIYHGLEESEDAILGRIQTMANQLSSIRHIDPSFEDMYERLLSVREELADISKESSRLAEDTEFDEEAIHQTNTRLNTIYRLEKKHHVSSLEALLEIEANIKSKLDAFSDLTSEIENLEKQSTAKEAELKSIASELTKSRKSVFANFEKSVHELLVTLSMEHAFIKVKMDEMKEIGPTGIDDLSILFAPNKGSDFLPLKDTASGGEISRLTLCIKSLVAGAITLPTLIFDEIDAGVSGDVAQKMGNILSKLSQKHQVICITHSPQISAKAESHFWVYKTDTAERTVTAMKKLDEEERVIEIAKMLSGNPPSEAAKLNAKELIYS